MLERLIPPFAITLARRALGRSEFRGHFGSFEEANAAAKGYNDPVIADAFASMSHPDPIHITSRSQQVLAAFAPAIIQRQRLAVLDVGGAHGFYYYALRDFLPPLDWTILETPQMAQRWPDGPICYVSDQSQLASRYDVALLSGVLQYLADPYAELAKYASRADFVILNRLPLVREDRLTIQRVRLHYRASYPAWFFGEARFLREVSAVGRVIMEWHAPEDSPFLDGRRVVYRGMLMRTH